MKYQLVLQWSFASINDYDAVIEIEDVLSKNLSSGSAIDGHDAGSGEMNIFIHTEDPIGAFNQIRQALGSHEIWGDMRAAYREFLGNVYTILWPRDLKVFKVS